MTQEEKIYCTLVTAINDTFKNWMIISDLDCEDYKEDISEIETEIYSSLESMQNLMINISSKVMEQKLLDNMIETCGLNT